MTVASLVYSYLYYKNVCTSIRLGLAMALLAMQYATLTLKTEILNLISNPKSFLCIIKSETNSYLRSLL